MRKALVLVTAVLIIGVVPATAVIGFCAKMPCCFASPAETSVPFAVGQPDCCDSINCAETPAQELGLSTAVKSLTAGLAVVQQPTAAIVNAPALLARDLHDLAPPPPTARQRLSGLSLLLI
jgi:hypothetical protein